MVSTDCRIASSDSNLADGNAIVFLDLEPGGQGSRIGLFSDSPAPIHYSGRLVRLPGFSGFDELAGPVVIDTSPGCSDPLVSWSPLCIVVGIVAAATRICLPNAPSGIRFEGTGPFLLAESG